MSIQGQIEALQVPLEAAPQPAGVPAGERVFVRELTEGQEVAMAFAVRERERRSRKNGDDFVRLVVADRTGTIEAVAWDGVDDCFECSAPGCVVYIEGSFSIHARYGAKITIRRIREAAETEYTHEVPATREATLVHAMDNLGGTLGSFDRIERELPEGQVWSRFDRGIDSAAYFRQKAA